MGTSPLGPPGGSGRVRMVECRLSRRLGPEFPEQASWGCLPVAPMI